MSSQDESSSVDAEKGGGATSLSTNYLEGGASDNAQQGLPQPFVKLILCSGIMTVIAITVAVKLLSGEEEAPHSIKLIVGTVNSITGSLLSASGMICQKWAHNQTSVTKKPATKTTMYWIGLFLLALGSVSTVVNLGILGQAVMAPFAALSLMYNAVLSRVILNETFTQYDLYSTLCIITGVGMAVGGASMSDIQSPEYSMDFLLDLYFRDSWFPPAYGVTIIVSILIANAYIKKQQKESTAFGLLHFSASAGLSGGFTGLAVKSSIEIAKGSFDTADTWEWVALILFIVAIPCALYPQLFYMNEGFKYFGTLKFVPLYQIFLILANMFSGIVFFREMEDYTGLSKALFFTGCAITLVGARILLAKVGDVEDDAKNEEAAPLSLFSGISA